MDRLDRKQIKHDEFVESTFKVFQWFETHPKPFLIGAAALVVATVAVWGVTRLTASSANSSADLLARGQAALDAPVAVGEAPKPDDPYRPSFASDAERAKKAAARLGEAADKAGGSAAKVASYLQGIALVEAGDGPAAVKALEAALSKLGSDPTLGGSVKSGLAQAYEMAGQADKAAATWKGLATDASFPKDVALTGLGRALEKQGKKDEAKATYRQVVDQFPGSPMASSVKSALERLGA